mgnify:CR=1 FL=1
MQGNTRRIFIITSYFSKFVVYFKKGDSREALPFFGGLFYCLRQILRPGASVLRGGGTRRPERSEAERRDAVSWQSWLVALSPSVG